MIWPRRVAVLPIRAYKRLVSPLLPPTCRFVPTCSAYAMEAIERYGVWRGGRLALARIARCHPWNPGGYDPVPGTSEVSSGEDCRVAALEEERKA